MIEKDFFEEFGLSIDELISLRQATQTCIFGKKGNFSRIITTNRHVSFSLYVAEQLLNCHHLLSRVGKRNLVNLNRDNKELCKNWQSVLEKLFSNPVGMRNKTVWLLFQACLESQQDFSLNVLPVHSNEIFLSRMFIEHISAAFERWTEKAQPLLNRSKRTLEISQIDMSVGGYEQGTDSDLAIILDIEDDWSASVDVASDASSFTGQLRKNTIIPLLFQVKCFTGLTADVSQYREKQGYQFNVLRQTECASNYLFFENGEERIATPGLPIVKSMNHVASVEMQASTDVFIQSVDFATFIIQSISGSNSVPFASSREDALNMIYANASADTLTRIILLGNMTGLKHEYEDALRNLRYEFKNSIKKPSGQTKR